MYERFDEICDLMRKYDVSSRSATACAPARSATPTHRAQFAELETLGEPTKVAWAVWLQQVMIEGLVHVPLRQIQDHCRWAAQGDAARRRSMMLGLARHRHRAGLLTGDFTSAIGAANIGWFGTAMLAATSRPKEHLEPARPQRRQGRRHRR